MSDQTALARSQNRGMIPATPSIPPSFVTTTFTLDGYRVVRNIGVVRGIVVRSRSVIGNLGAAFQMIFGGHISVFTTLCEQARREALARRPMFESPLPLGSYQLTSAYANRWGSFHGGIDMAAPLGTPIHAVTDGVIKEAGPASGYGNWVQLQADDGTITMYGHMSSSGVLVHAGQRVTAGDVIALVGNEGFSTGPHVHFEVWKNGNTKIDPAPWLARHGVQLANYTG